jgi:DNA-directed RNA polymerase specialized sigma24 family protein
VTEPCTAPDYLNTDEVRQRLRSLDASQWARLRGWSRYLAYDHRILSDDLRQEAFVRVLDGRRRCNRAFDIVNTLIGIMRSLVSIERTSSRASRSDKLDLNKHDAADDASLPDSAVLDGQFHRRTLSLIREQVEADLPLKQLLDAVLTGMQGAAIQAHLGVDSKQLATLRRRLKRTIEAATKGRERP